MVRIIPAVLEMAGAVVVLVAVGVLVSPWIAAALGGLLLVSVGFLIEYRLEATE